MPLIVYLKYICPSQCTIYNYFKDEILCMLIQVLCKDKERCTSSIVLQFFGFDILAEKKYFKKRKEYLEKMKDSKAKVCFISYKYIF